MYTHVRRILSHCRFHQLTLAITLCLLVVPTQAAGLDDAIIESYLSSLKDIRPIMDDAEVIEPDSEHADYNASNRGFGSTYPRSSSMAEELRKHPPTYRKFSAIVERYGFESLEEWEQVGNRISAAYMAINMEGLPAFDTSAMESYMPSMEDLPAADQEYMRNMMESSAMFNRAARHAPTQDIEAVRPYTDEIMALQGIDAE